jgi:hypothetical protein
MYIKTDWSSQFRVCPGCPPQVGPQPLSKLLEVRNQTQRRNVPLPNLPPEGS